MPVKTDKNDVRSIAQVMRVGWFSIVHIKSAGSQELRRLLANRKMLLVKQIDIENEIRGTLRVFGLKLSGRIQQAAFERQAMELVADRPELAAMVPPMLIARAALREQCAVLHKMMLKAVRGDDTCRRLLTVPGVGALTAVTFVTTIDDPVRFERSRDVGAHLGLSPRKSLYQASLALLTRTQRSFGIGCPRTWKLARSAAQTAGTMSARTRSR